MNGDQWLGKSAAILLIGIAMAGCANFGSKYDAGFVDHRFVGRDGNIGPKYFQDNNMPSESDLLKKGDSVAIRLTSVFTCDFAENNAFPDGIGLYFVDALKLRNGTARPVPCSNVGLKRSKAYTRGEIAILADVFEQGSGRTIGFQKDSLEPESARVVYYDDDIRESGQYFSLANIPIYGPITYGGGPLYIRLYMLELDDDEAKQTNAMLTQLADLGGKAYPPASPVLKALSSVGSALLAGEQDDLEFRYTMTFDATGGLSTQRLPLAVGTYILVKSSDRSKDFNWQNARFDRGKGALVTNDGPLRTVTYMTISVTRNEPALQQDGAQLYSQFSSTAPSRAVDFSKITEAAESLGNKYSHVAELDKARTEVATITRYVQQQGVGGAILPVHYLQATERLTQLICSSPSISPSADPPSTLELEDIDYLLASLPAACRNSPNEGLSGFWATGCSAPQKICSYSPPSPPP